MLRTTGALRVSNEGELKNVGETVVLNFGAVANEYRQVGGEWVSTPHFYQCVIWDTGAKKFAERVKKGDLFFIEDGELRQETWEKDGQKFSRHIVRINRFTPAKKADNDN